MFIEDDYKFEHSNGKEYTVRVRTTFDNELEKTCGQCGVTPKEGADGTNVEIIEMYDENYVAVSKKSPVYRAAMVRYDAYGKWHFLCSDCYRDDDSDLYDVADVM